MRSKHSIKHVDKYKQFLGAEARADKALSLFDAATKDEYTPIKKKRKKYYIVPLILIGVGVSFLLS